MHLIVIKENGNPVEVRPEDFGKYRSVIIDGINASIKYIYNKVKEKYYVPDQSRQLTVGKYTVKTSLKGGLAFTPDGQIYIEDTALKQVLNKLIRDIASLMTTYKRADEFLSILQTPEFWALIVFVGADQELTDTLLQAELEFFNVTWAKSSNIKQKEMRQSIVNMLLALKNGNKFDLKNLKLYDNEGNPVSITGQIEPC